MSEFHVEVCILSNVSKHPDADTLSIGEVNGYPVIFRTDEYHEGDKVVHVPVDSIVPSDDPRWAFLGKYTTIRPKRLRGVFSLGLIATADPAWEVGLDVQEALRIKRYDPDAYSDKGNRSSGGSFRSGPTVRGPHLPIYDIEGHRKYARCFITGEPVWISEKRHGASSKYLHDGDNFHVGSRKEWKDQEDASDLWVRVALRYNLKEKLAVVPGFALYGEVFGQVQDLRYGAGPTDVFFAAFDVFDVKMNKWLDVDDFFAFCAKLEIPIVPTLYRGPWKPTLVDLCEGYTTDTGVSHVREGFVLKPLKERYDRRLGRVVTKMVGQGYHLRNKLGQPPEDLKETIEVARVQVENEIECILSGKDPEVQEALKNGPLTQEVLLTMLKAKEEEARSLALAHHLSTTMEVKRVDGEIVGLNPVEVST